MPGGKYLNGFVIRGLWTRNGGVLRFRFVAPDSGEKVRSINSPGREASVVTARLPRSYLRLPSHVREDVVLAALLGHGIVFVEQT
jgi:hypothetical protein